MNPMVRQSHASATANPMARASSASFVSSASSSSATKKTKLTRSERHLAEKAEREKQEMLRRATKTSGKKMKKKGSFHKGRGGGRGRGNSKGSSGGGKPLQKSKLAEERSKRVRRLSMSLRAKENKSELLAKATNSKDEIAHSPAEGVTTSPIDSGTTVASTGEIRKEGATKPSATPRLRKYSAPPREQRSGDKDRPKNIQQAKQNEQKKQQDSPPEPKRMSPQSDKAIAPVSVEVSLDASVVLNTTRRKGSTFKPPPPTSIPPPMTDFDRAAVRRRQSSMLVAKEKALPLSENERHQPSDKLHIVNLKPPQLPPPPIMSENPSSTASGQNTSTCLPAVGSVTNTADEPYTCRDLPQVSDNSTAQGRPGGQPTTSCCLVQ